MASVWEELKRRNVVRVAIAYAIVSWLILQIADVLTPLLRLPEWVGGFVFLLLVIGFLLALILSWAYELTPEGLKKEKDVERSESITHVTGRKLDFVIIAMLVVALGYFSYDKFVLDPSRDAELVQTTTEAVTLRAAETGKSEIPDKSIAVLAFVNMSDDPGNEYFSDGLSEEILNLLARIPGLKVIGRTSSFAFKGKNEDLRIIGQALGVNTLLEGSVRKSGDEIRITAQLIDTSDASHIWSETYDRTLSDIFAVQDDVAAAVVESLRVTLLGELPKAQRTDPEAYSLFLQSNAPARRMTKESTDEAIRLLTQALAIDPEYAAGWAALARVQTNQAYDGQVAPKKGYARAEASARRALSLDPNSAIAIMVLGAVEMLLRWDFEKAGKWFNKARKVAPGRSMSLNALAIWTELLGQAEAALALYQEAVDRDPLNVTYLSNLALSNIRTGRFDIARLHIEAMKQILPDHNEIPGRSALLEYRLGNFEETLLYSDQWESPDHRLRACAFHSLGRFSEAEAVLEDLQQRETPPAFAIAHVYTCWGEEEKAFEWLERAYEERDPSLIWLRANTEMQNLHHDPRWEALLQKLGISDEHVEKLGL